MTEVELDKLKQKFVSDLAKSKVEITRACSRSYSAAHYESGWRFAVSQVASETVKTMWTTNTSTLAVASTFAGYFAGRAALQKMFDDADKYGRENDPK